MALLDEARWEWHAEDHGFEEHLGRPALRLGNGLAAISDAGFENGVLEVDMAIGPERSISGVAWRISDPGNYESFFLRPHRRGFPDSTQYTPVWNGISSWQLHHGRGYTSAIAFPTDEWLHLRIAVSGVRAEVFVSDMDTPALIVDQLKHAQRPGGIGLYGGGVAYYSNLTIERTRDVALTTEPPPDPEPPPGVVDNWLVSDAFAERAIAGRRTLGPEDLAARSWTALAAEPGGLADLGRVNALRDGRNTVFARCTLRSAAERVARLDLGFSDRVAVFLNGRLLYTGDDAYLSRDHRFLGIIGWYDALYLPLAAGDNDLVLAVSEDFGGWGVQAILEPEA